MNNKNKVFDIAVTAKLYSCDIMLIQVKCPNTVQFYSFMGPLVVQLEEQQLDTFFSLPLTYQVA